MRRLALFLCILAFAIPAYGNGGATNGITLNAVTLKTPYGKSRRVVTPQGEHDVVSSSLGSGTERHRIVHSVGGELTYTELGPIATPYGPTKLVVQKGVLTHRVIVAKKAYEVRERQGGGFDFVDSHGTVFHDFIGTEGSVTTPHGTALRIGTTDTFALPTHGYSRSTTGYRLIRMQDGKFISEHIPGLVTPYGNAQIAFEEGHVVQRIKIRGKIFGVEQHGDGFRYTDHDGQTHDDIVAIGNAIQTPRGPAKRVMTPRGEAHVISTRGYLYGSFGMHHELVTLREGKFVFEELPSISTPYGRAAPLLDGNTLVHRIKIFQKSYVVEATEGGVRFLDGAGRTFEGYLGEDGAIITPRGRTTRALTETGPADILVLKSPRVRGQVLHERVTIANGRFAFEAIQPIPTRHGSAEPQIVDGRLVHTLEVEGKTYFVRKAGEHVEIVDEHGHAYVDTYVQKVATSKPAPSTALRLYDATLAPLPNGSIVKIKGTGFMSKAVYDELRDAMLEALTMYDPKTHYFIGLGSDPHPILAFLENVGGKGLATNFPASGKYHEALDPYVLDPYVRKLIPPEVLNGSKTLVFVDQTTSDVNREGTLAQISRVFEKYLANIGSPAKVARLAFSPYKHPEDTGTIDTAKYPEVGKFLGRPYEHVVSQYDRHVLGVNTLKQLIERPAYAAFKAAMRLRMQRDAKLDAFLQHSLGEERAE